jgi:hypothetical protein
VDRVPYEYKGQNMAVKVDKNSQYPYYLAMQFLYQGGQTEIVIVDVSQVNYLLTLISEIAFRKFISESCIYVIF